MFDIIAYTVQAKDLKAGQRIIEARFGAGSRRMEKSYEVLEVRVGRFVNFTIADEAGVTLRTYSPEFIVEIPGNAFAGEVFAA
jgi:hypothetical protein